MKRFLREPLIHFLLIGAVIFSVYHYVQPDRGIAPSSKQIQLSLDELGQLTVLFQSQWRREPTPEEFRHLVENKVEEEVLYREALAMGLDKDDTIVRRRMAQKMHFLAEDVAAAREPTTAELKAWYAKNNDKFTMPQRLSFRHLYFSLTVAATAPAPTPRGRWPSSPASQRMRNSPPRSPTRSCFRTITATAPRITSARSSGRSSPRPLRNSQQARGRGLSSPDSAGTWFLSTL